MLFSNIVSTFSYYLNNMFCFFPRWSGYNIWSQFLSFQKKILVLFSIKLPNHIWLSSDRIFGELFLTLYDNIFVMLAVRCSTQVTSLKYLVAIPMKVRFCSCSLHGMVRVNSFLVKKDFESTMIATMVATTRLARSGGRDNTIQYPTCSLCCAGLRCYND